MVESMVESSFCMNWYLNLGVSWRAGWSCVAWSSGELGLYALWYQNLGVSSGVVKYGLLVGYSVGVDCSESGGQGGDVLRRLVRSVD